MSNLLENLELFHAEQRAKKVYNKTIEEVVNAYGLSYYFHDKEAFTYANFATGSKRYSFDELDAHFIKALKENTAEAELEAQAEVVRVSALKIYRFVGRGSYSDYHDYDTGLTSSIIGDAMPYGDALQMDAYSSREWRGALPTPLMEGIFVRGKTEYGGSREAIGFVIAKSVEEAQNLLQEYDRAHCIKVYSRV